ncbi:MAG: class I SAM-dependent methyltransferase [Alphaproteobacteria bacterium]
MERVKGLRQRTRRWLSGLRHGDVGYNFPISEWDRRYREGEWDVFESVHEVPRYVVTAAYVKQLKSQPTVLDAGCGYGTLARHIDPFGYSHYTGLDLSGEAIARAQGDNIRDSEFIQCDWNDWSTDRKFDVVVFCDSICHSRAPADTLRHYSGMLNDGGGIVVTLFRHRNMARIWKTIRANFDVAFGATVTNSIGQTWDVAAIPVRR